MKVSAVAVLSAGVVAVGLGACSSNAPKASDLVAEVKADKFAFNCSSELLKPLAGFVRPEEATEDKWYSQEELKKAGSGATSAYWYSGKQACKALEEDQKVNEALKTKAVTLAELETLTGKDFFLLGSSNGVSDFASSSGRAVTAEVKDGVVVKYSSSSKNLNENGDFK